MVASSVNLHSVLDQWCYLTAHAQVIEPGYNDRHDRVHYIEVRKPNTRFHR